MGPDDRTLLRRTHAGHEASARELWDRHAGWMLACARSVLGRRHAHAAEDAVQTVFCRVLQLDRRTIRQVRDVRPWLARAVRRQALNHLRTARRAAARDLAHPAPRPSPGVPPATTLPDLHAALDTLPRRQREVIYLRHVAGLSVDHTAEILGLPRGTVASRTHAALAKLRDILREPQPTPRVQPSEPNGARHAVHVAKSGTQLG